MKANFSDVLLNCNNLRFTSYVLLNSTKQLSGKTIRSKINQTNFIFKTIF
jgi:hypothetical protein